MKLGDHVRALVGGAYRHGIDCGDRTVLHLARDVSGRTEVRRSLAADFAAGDGRVESVVHREGAFPPRMVVARAFSRMRDPAAAAAFGTDEAFATWCLTGRPPEPGFVPAAAPPRPERPRRASAKKARRARRAAPRTAKRKVRQAAPRRPRRSAGRPAPRRKPRR